MQDLHARACAFLDGMSVLASRAWDAAAGHRLSLGVAAGALVIGTAAIAAPGAREHMRTQFQDAAERAAYFTSTAAPTYQMVWTGKDLDGDGQPDFVNPTGGEVREHDAYGYGHFGARRDGGSREHEGVDFIATAGQQVLAPISGFVTKIGLAYPGDTTLQFVEITNPALGQVARVFYIDPLVEVGGAVALGHPVGIARTLQDKYAGGMTDHVHLELMDTRGQRFDAQRVLTARLETVNPKRG